METSPLFWRRWKGGLSYEICEPANLIGLTDGIRDTAATVSRREKKSVSHGRPELRVDGRQAILDAHQTADIAGVTVGVPAGRVGDHESPAEVVLRVEQAEDDYGVIRYDMAVAGELIISVALRDPFPGDAPISVRPMPTTHITGQPCYQAIRRKIGEAGFDQMINPRFDECLCFHRGQKLGGINRFTIMAHRSSFSGQLCRQSRTARSDERP